MDLLLFSCEATIVAVVGIVSWRSVVVARLRDVQQRWEASRPDEHERAMHRDLLDADHRKTKEALAVEVEKIRLLNPPQPTTAADEIRTSLAAIQVRIHDLSKRLDSMRADSRSSWECIRQASSELQLLYVYERDCLSRAYGA